MSLRSFILVTILVFGSLMFAVTPILAEETVAQPKVVDVSSSDSDACIALLDNGTLWAWGDNTCGQIGNGTRSQYWEKVITPVMVPIDHVVEAVTGGYHTVALKDDGTVWEWGHISSSRLGEYVLVPRQVPGLSGIKHIEAGDAYNFAIADDGSVWVWGNNIYGNLGNSESEEYVYPPVKLSIDHVAQVSSGSGTELLKEDGTVWISGSGQPEFSQVDISNVTEISSSGSGFMLALKDDGTVWGWGDNTFYCLGNYTATIEQLTPVRVGELTDVIAISAGATHAMALKKDGTVWVWGHNNAGTLGNGVITNYKTIDPVKVVGLHNVTAISAGYGPGLTLKEDGSVWTWGTTDQNVTYETDPKPRQVFISSSEPAATPQPVSAATIEKSVTAGNGTNTKFDNATNVTRNWAVSVNDTIGQIAFDGTSGLYVFGNHTIYRIDSNGKQLWSLEIPEQWQINSRYYRPSTNYEMTGGYLGVGSHPVFDVNDGNIYLYLKQVEDDTDGSINYGNRISEESGKTKSVLMAISPSGIISWTLPLETGVEAFDATMVQAVGDRIYIFHHYNETVTDKNGTILFAIQNVSDPASVDESGQMYVTRSAVTFFNTGGKLSVDYRIPSSTIDSYYPNGTLAWSRDIGERPVRQFIAEEIRSKYSSLPIYQNGTLYVPVKDGIIALDRQGKVVWLKRFDTGYYGLFSLMPLDSHDNVYLCYLGSGCQEDHGIHLNVISQNGLVTTGPLDYSTEYSKINRPAAKNGIIYDTIVAGFDYKEPVENLPYVIITAYDVVNSSKLWSYNISPAQIVKATVDETTIGYIESVIDWDYADPMQKEDSILGNNLPASLPDDYANEGAFIEVIPGNDSIYMVYRAVKYEYPATVGKSKVVYASGIYAISLDGKPMLATEPESPITAVAVNNSTVFFSTADGQIGTVVIGGVVVLALLTAIALAAKLFLFGTVTRGRGRVDHNENRNLVTAYIKENPGSTLYEISRGMKMNMGTVRYHLFILEMNHKIATFNDGKFVRYFPNSNCYSREEQLIISLMRRDATGRVIRALSSAPGLTNAELCERLGQPDSAISKLLKELHSKGVVDRGDTRGGRAAFYVNEKFACIIDQLPVQANG